MNRSLGRPLTPAENRRRIALLRTDPAPRQGAEIHYRRGKVAKAKDPSWGWGKDRKAAA